MFIALCPTLLFIKVNAWGVTSVLQSSVGLGGLISPQAVQVKVSTAHVFHVHQFCSSSIHNENVIQVPVLRTAGVVLLRGISSTCC